MTLFCSLGMFIIDEIHFANGTSLYDVLGGGGIYALVGSRLVLGSENSQLCGGVIDIGNDCPPAILDELKRWGTGAVFRYDESRRCTRGWNKYGDNEFRDFKYTTPKKRIQVDDLAQYEHLINTKSFHLLYSPSRVMDILGQMAKYRPDRPLTIYEAIPDLCTPEHLQDLNEALRYVDVFSPNAAEAAAFFGEQEPTDRVGCERVAQKHAAKAVVLRCGAMGCLLVAPGVQKWFPAYHSDPTLPDYKLVDPTGCGNTFVGALATKLAQSGNLELACIEATVASGWGNSQVVTVHDDVSSLKNLVSDGSGKTHGGDASGKTQSAQGRTSGLGWRKWLLGGLVLDNLNRKEVSCSTDVASVLGVLELELELLLEVSTVDSDVLDQVVSVDLLLDGETDSAVEVVRVIKTPARVTNPDPMVLPTEQRSGPPSERPNSGDFAVLVADGSAAVQVALGWGWGTESRTTNGLDDHTGNGGWVVVDESLLQLLKQLLGVLLLGLASLLVSVWVNRRDLWSLGSVDQNVGESVLSGSVSNRQGTNGVSVVGLVSRDKLMSLVVLQLVVVLLHDLQSVLVGLTSRTSPQSRSKVSIGLFTQELSKLLSSVVSKGSTESVNRLLGELAHQLSDLWVTVAKRRNSSSRHGIKNNLLFLGLWVLQNKVHTVVLGTNTQKTLVVDLSLENVGSVFALNSHITR
ncbi:hypothetical protein OGAPHI_003261 [Ogataea philodendri]|uniref:Carbohydrate kinase PfkB domain-containing protein n=1 Tax=Ogataea philodendri TaxID=1378263 RepID=A0A9P8P7K9_9ASCO|nr:uncharacterized protein OGAPHI_003261 [Ogataea philodendri]KAH3666812.1 hypothetical protein OGAPHI_003261 [Ogataea philodendri]